MSNREKSSVTVVNIERNQAYEAFCKLFKLEELPIRDHTNIVLKINLVSFRPYETGEITNPHVLEALVRYIRNSYKGVDITLVESDATVTRPDLFFKAFGFEEIQKKYDLNFVNLTKDRLIEKDIKGLYFKKIKVPETIENADFFITLPKLKSHSLTKVSICLKNQFGALPDPYKVKFHPYIDDVIADVNAAMKPDFCIVDGVISNNVGYPRLTTLLAAGGDPVAVDTMLAKAMGFHPFFIGHIRKSAAQNVGTMKFQRKGDMISKLNFSCNYLDYLAARHKLIRKSKVHTMYKILQRTMGINKMQIK